MPLTKPQKQELITELTGAVADSGSMVFVNFHGIPVAESSALRSTMRAAGIRMKVAKKTLLKRVLGESSVEGSIPALEGEIAVVYGVDLLAPARESYEFQKTHKDNFKIVGGIFEGRFVNEAEMTEIATIPGEGQLRGMFVNVINSPIQGLVIALNAIAEKKA